MAWRLEEEAPRLLALCREAGIGVDDLVGLPVKRQREKAAERLLLCRALGRPVTLEHTGQGAPFIEGETVNISISHTMALVVLAWDEEHVIGIDAESLDRQQVLRVRDKFLNDNEKAFITPDDKMAHVIAWTAKEAIIKLTRNSAIDWTCGISLEPFDTASWENGGEITFATRCGERRCRLLSRCLDGHCITLASDEPIS